MSSPQPPADGDKKPTPADVAKATSSAAAPKAGDLVRYRHPDPVFGTVLEGFGLVLRASDGGSAVAVAPIDLLHVLEVLPEGLTTADVPDDPDEG